MMHDGLASFRGHCPTQKPLSWGNSSPTREFEVPSRLSQSMVVLSRSLQEPKRGRVSGVALDAFSREAMALEGLFKTDDCIGHPHAPWRTLGDEELLQRISGSSGVGKTSTKRHISLNLSQSHFS